MLLVVVLGLRIVDIALLVFRPRLLFAYLRIWFLEVFESPYLSHRSREARQITGGSGRNAEELLYGETSLVTGIWLFWRAGLRSGDTFVDLGAGRGRALLAARWLGARAHGVELLPSHVDQTKSALAGVRVNVKLGDVSAADLTDVQMVYSAWTAFHDDTRGEIVENVKLLRAGTRLVVVDQRVKDSALREVSEHNLLYSWGIQPAWVYERT